MKTYISLLRGINVSGQKLIKMEQLRSSVAELGFSSLKTYIQSGNIIFQYKKIEKQKVSELIKKNIAKTFGFDVPVITVDQEDLQAVVAFNPYLKTSPIDLKKLYVTFLSDFPDQEKIKTIDPSKYHPDEFTIVGKTIYLYYPDAAGNSKLTNKVFESRLKLEATTRNWNTVNKLLALSLENG